MSDNVFDLDGLLTAAKRQRWVIAACVAGCVVLALAALFVITPKYDGNVEILIDARAVNPSANPNDSAGLVFNSANIDTQVELIKSDGVARRVIEKLNLTADPEFNQPSALAQIVARLTAKLPFNRTAPTAERLQLALERRVLDNFGRNLDAERIKQTFAMSVKFWSIDAQKAVKIANAVGDAYVEEQLAARTQTARSASEWMEARLRELRDKSVAADAAVQEFKAKNNLVTAGGRSANDQQLSDLTGQLATARGETARLQARYDSMQSVILKKQIDGALNESLNNPVITDLQTKYLALAKRMHDLTDLLGPTHVQVQTLQRQMKGYEQQILAELSRTSSGYATELELAKAREKSLRETVANLTGSQANNDALASALHQRESDSDVYKTMYQSYLQKFQDLTQQLTFPVTEARVISYASLPPVANYPKKPLILAVGLVLGLAIGTGVAMAREHLEKSFRTGDEIGSYLGVDFLGSAPLMARRLLAGASKDYDGVHVPAGLCESARAPLSRLTETMRSVKLHIEAKCGTKKGRVIGILSTVSGEGKTLIAANLAFALGSARKVLLIDGDLRRAGLSRAIYREVGPAEGGGAGFAEVLTGAASIASAAFEIPGSGISFLRASALGQVTNSGDLLEIDALTAAIAEASEIYDLVVIDLAPVTAVVDSRAFAPVVDAFVYVVSWGETPKALVRNTFLTNQEMSNKVVGAILNKVNANHAMKYMPAATAKYMYEPY